MAKLAIRFLQVDRHRIVNPRADAVALQTLQHHVAIRPPQLHHEEMINVFHRPRRFRGQCQFLRERGQQLAIPRGDLATPAVPVGEVR